MGIPPRPPSTYIPNEWFQNRHASGYIADVDFEHAAKGIRDTGPGDVVACKSERGRSGAGDGDEAGDDAEAHEAAEGEFGAGADVEVAEEEGGEEGAEEVG